jgi:hypothetical protein
VGMLSQVTCLVLTSWDSVCLRQVRVSASEIMLLLSARLEAAG